MPDRILRAIAGSGWRNWREPDFWLLVILAGGLAFRLYFFLKPFDWLVSFFTTDDFYYYANTAYHIAMGNGSTFDGGITYHNGFHPLFLLLLVPFFLIGFSKVAIVYIALALLTGASLAMVVLAYRLGRQLGGGWLALATPVALAVGLYFVRLSFRGFETPIATALVLATFLAVVTDRPGWQIGLWLGLAGLARIDNGFVAVPVALYLFSHRRWRVLFETAAVALALMAPWLLWSQSHFGSVLPGSGIAKAFHGELAHLWTGLAIFCREAFYTVVGEGWNDKIPPEIASAVGVLCVAQVVRQGRKSFWFTIYVLGLAAIYAISTNPHYLHQYVRYCIPAFTLLAVVFFAVSWRWQRFWLLLFTVLVIGGNIGYVRSAARSPALANFVGVCHREVPAILAKVVGEHDLVGCFDSGALGYYSRLPVVNLDGLANAEVVRMLQSEEGGHWGNRYRRYFAKKGITVLVGGMAFSWKNYFSDLDTWEVLHAPVPSTSGGDVVFLRIPELEDEPEPGSTP